MPSYAPRNLPTKKSELLNYKVFEFLKSLQKEESQEKLLVKANQVKTAKLNLLKARLASIKSFSTEDISEPKQALNEKINHQIIKWESISFSEIENYCKEKN